MSEHNTDDQPTGLLPEDYEAAGVELPAEQQPTSPHPDIAPGQHSNKPEQTDASRRHPVYLGLERLLPDGKIDDEAVEALFTFARDRMNKAGGYSLVLSVFLQGGATLQMMGGPMPDCCFLMDIAEMSHRERLERAKSEKRESKKKKPANWGGILGKLGL